MSADEDLFKAKQKDSGPVLFLSLFLLLLAFFILLNSLTTLEETKARAVISSVSSTFQTTKRPDTSVQILISTLGPVPEPEEVISEVERLWVTAIPLTKSKVITPGREMEMRLNVSELFLGGKATLRADRQDLINATADALSARIEGFTAVMYFVLGTEDLKAAELSMESEPVAPVEQEEVGIVNLDDPGAELTLEAAPDERDLSFARVTAFANTIVTTGSPPSGVTVGLNEGDTETIRIRFSIYPNGSVYNTFSDLVDE